MLLDVTDCHLLAARAALALGGTQGRILLDEAAEGAPATAREHVAVASRRIEGTGYGRRWPDLALVRARLALAADERQIALEELDVVTRYIERGWKIHECELKKLRERFWPRVIG